MRLFIAYRATSRAVLFAPYLYHFITGVRGISIVEFGLLQSIYYYVAVALEVPSGVVADRFGRRFTLVVGALLGVAGCALRVVAFDFWTFFAAEVCYASALALTSGADSAILYDSLAHDDRTAEYPRAESYSQASWLALTAVGMPLTDLFLVRDGDPMLAFVASGALMFAGAIFAIAMKEPPMHQRLGTREITVESVRDIARIPGILRLLFYSAGVFVLLRAAIQLFFNPILETNGIPVHLYGSILALANVAGAIFAWRSHWLMRLVGERAFLFAMPASMLLMYSLLIPADTPWVAGLFCIQGAALGAYPVAVRTLLNRMVPTASRRATILSFESMLCRVVYAVLVIAIAATMEDLGTRAAIGLTMMLGCLPFFLMARLPRSPGGHPQGEEVR